jgi:predicted O-methyltransferase YrrM
MIREALTKPFSEIVVHPISETGLFDFLAPLVPGLPEVPESLRASTLPDDPGACVLESSEPEVSRTLYSLARLLKARVVVEVGVFRGATSRFLARALVDNGGGTLHLVDMSGEALALAQKAVGEPSQVAVLGHLGGSVSPEVLGSVPGDLDLVFLDAAHTEEGVRDELAAWLPKMRPGGVLAVHDTIHMRGVCKAAHEQAARRAVLTLSTGRGSGLTLIRS